MPLSRLNHEQLKAARAKEGYNLIIASAGTGKTSTIVARIGYLLQKGIKPEEILLLTFTNKAASEMIERVGAMFDIKIAKKIESGTFHSISYRFLKESGQKILLKQPKELKVVLQNLYLKRNFSYYESQIPPYSSSYLYDLHSLYQNQCLDISFSQWIEKNNKDHSIYAEIYEDLLKEFDEEKRRFGYVDFNDLLILMKEYLTTTKKKFHEVLVDEYQDTNPLQSSLIDSFKFNSLFCVGDYDQSIYAFNGADINIIGSFKKRFKNATIYSLNKNYRSSKYILSLANKVIEKNPRIYPKKLEVTRYGNFALPKLLVFDDLYAQYSAITQKIKLSSTPYEEIAVIFRNNASADGIEASLKAEGIGCKRKGGVNFFDSREIKAILNLFIILLNPKDMMAFIHIFEYAKGVGGVFAKDIFDALYKIGDGNIIKGILNPKDIKNPFKKGIINHQLGLFDDDIEFGSVGRFKKLNFEEKFLKNPILKHPKISIEFAKFIYSFYQLVKSTTNLTSPTSIINSIINSTLFENIIDSLATKRATLKDKTVDQNLKQEAVDNIKRKALLLLNISKSYKDRYKLINSLVLGANEISEGEGVNLLSIHASKGLEFKEVYIIDLMDGRFPNRKLLSKNGGNLDEERRLFYVAVTRAKDILYLSYAKYDRVKKIEYLHSPFLVEAGLIKEDMAIP